MITLTKEQAKEIGFSEYSDGKAVELDEVRGATIAGLYVDSDPQENRSMDRIILILSDGRAIIINEAMTGGAIEMEFGTLEKDEEGGDGLYEHDWEEEQESE